MVSLAVFDAESVDGVELGDIVDETSVELDAEAAGAEVAGITLSEASVVLEAGIEVDEVSFSRAGSMGAVNSGDTVEVKATCEVHSLPAIAPTTI